MSEKFTVFIDPAFDATERSAIGREIIDYIVNRTTKGKGIDNVPFKSSDGTTAYAKTYQKHRDFSTGGKNNRPINLTLTGDMLNSIEVLDNTLAGRIVIGISDGENADKAGWLQERGYKFLGVSEKEQANILSKFKKLTTAEVTGSKLSESVARNFLKGLLGG